MKTIIVLLLLLLMFVLFNSTVLMYATTAALGLAIVCTIVSAVCRSVLGIVETIKG